ncbi:hypothetical protein HDV57DRAFT_510160 [Trichoderma longibrachiatum]|uniref:Uncharacterized protein n=1 Tax=Trichoderma longibrachiatum ATCC 18648 TaxID=983965 RepID=A0A2T4BRS0_TRILO|nr:hypothetical protein M440DRAFT_1385664 [Trichoderma longibrachiatum ATCC 18648]
MSGYGYGYGRRRPQPDEEEDDPWVFKEHKETVQFKAGSIPRPKRTIRRKKKQDGDTETVAPPIKEEQHADTTPSKEVAALLRAYEEQQAKDEATAYENPPIDDEDSDDDASSREEERSPIVEGFEANFEDGLVMAAGPSLNDELGSDYDGYSDNGEVLGAASDEDDSVVDPVGASPSPSSSATSDESSDAGDGLVESTSIEPTRSLEADVLEADVPEMRRECDGLRKELASRDVRTAELEEELESCRKRAEALQADLESRDMRLAALMETLRSHEEKARATALQADLVSRDERIAALTKDLASRDEERVRIEMKLETREKQVTTVTKDLESRNQIVAALEQDLDSRNSQNATLIDDLDTRDKELATLEKERESHDKESDALRKSLLSRDEEMAALKKQLEARSSEITALEKELGSRNKELDENLAALERDLALRDKSIAGPEARNSQLINGTTKTALTRDSATNTEASPSDGSSLPDTTREAENDQRLLTSEREQPSMPATAVAMKMAELVQFLQMCSAMLKTAYLACISLAGTASIRARSVFSAVRSSESFQKAVDAAQQSLRASALYLAAPFWIIMSFALFMSIWRERSYWVQANAVTRKHLLKHATGVSEIADWEVFFAIGSAAML